jgi:SAM-dependent methyltransferase
MSLPIEFRPQPEFDALREKLQQSGYRYEAILERRQVGSLAEIENRIRNAPASEEPADALDVLIFLLVEGGSARRSRVVSMLGEDFVALLDRFRLLVEDPLRPDFVSGSMWMTPVHDLFCISDRWWAPGGGSAPPPKDAVYPASAPNTLRFLSLLPAVRCKSYLDLCCGTGIAALIAARDYADHAYAFDLAERSTICADFNRRLNGLSNVTVGTGDLYEPGKGLQFDYITAHPPYVPVLEPKFVFHDGGNDGEQVVRRVVQECPPYLAPGGRLFMLSLATDRKTASYEQRVREWLGEESANFDVAALSRRDFDPAEYAVRKIVQGKGGGEEAMQWKEMFASLEIRSLFYGMTILQKHAEPRKGFTLRRQFGPNSGRDEVQAQLDWETAACNGVGTRAVLEQPLKPTPGIQLAVKHNLAGEGWEETEYSLSTQYPFKMECTTQSWIAYLLSRCDGKRTGLDHLEHLKSEGIVQPDTPAQEFAQALIILVSGGFLCLPTSP